MHRILSILLILFALAALTSCELISADDNTVTETRTVTDDGTLIVVDGNGSTTLVYNAGQAIAAEDGGAE